MNERRKYVRFKISLTGKLIGEGGMQLSPQIQMVDFSRDGLRITFPQTAFLKNDIAKLELCLSNRKSPISVEGRTKWQRPSGLNWDMGMSIERIDPVEKTEILNYAYRIWREDEREKEKAMEREKHGVR